MTRFSNHRKATLPPGKAAKEASAKTTGNSRKEKLESPPKRHKPSPTPDPRHHSDEDDICIELDDIDATSLPSPDENKNTNAGLQMIRLIGMCSHVESCVLFPSLWRLNLILDACE